VPHLSLFIILRLNKFFIKAGVPHFSPLLREVGFHTVSTFDLEVAHVGRTFLSDAFDVVGVGFASSAKSAASLPRWPPAWRYFGTSEQFWLNLQDAFAVHQVKKRYSKELRAIKPLAASASR
jgi:hypothetical protein